MGSTALAAAVALPGAAAGAVTKAAGDPFHGLKVGMVSYTLRKFSLDEALKMTQQVRLKTISLKDAHLSLKSSPAERAEARRKVEAAGLTLIGCGVITMNNEADVREAFQYAQDAGMPMIMCNPDLKVLDLVETLAKQRDIRIAIHNHGPDNQHFASALEVFNAVKDRDAHMGVCIDVGHTVRLGEDPIPVIEQCAPRLYDFHIKDVSGARANVANVPVGAGVIDIVAVLKTLRAVKYSGQVGLEYEANENAPMPGVIESIAYIRGVLAAI